MQELIDLSRALAKDYEEATSDLSEYDGTPDIKREIITIAGKIQKMRIDAVKGITDTYQRELDQRLKLDEFRHKKQIEEERLKLAQDGNKKNDGPTVYFVPTYEKQQLPNGQTKMVKVSGSESAGS